jgi:hypothetical protein
LQYYDKNKANRQDGLKNEAPMPIVLKIEKTDKGLKFEQTEHTNRYLAVS